MVTPLHQIELIKHVNTLLASFVAEFNQITEGKACLDWNSEEGRKEREKATEGAREKGVMQISV